MAQLGTGYTLLESGVGGDFLVKVRKATMTMVNPDRPHRVSDALDAVKAVTKTIKSFAGQPATKFAETYISVTGVSLLLQGSALLQYNESVLAPQILKADPSYYNNNIQRIFPNQFGGGGSSDTW